MKAMIIALMLLAAPFAAAQLTVEQATFELILTRVNPIPIESGKSFDAWITLKNIGARQADNLMVEVMDSFPFTVDPSESKSQSFGKVQPGEQVTLKRTIRVDDGAFDGDAKLKIRFSPSGQVFTTQDLIINVEAKHAVFATGLLDTDPENLYSDTDNNKLSIELQNIGESDAKLVTATLNLPAGFKPSKTYSNLANLGSITADGSKQAVFYVDIDEGLKPGAYNGFLELQYKEQDSDSKYKRQTLNIDMPVRAKPEFTIESVDLPKSIAQGQKVQMKITARNTGLQEAKSVSVRGLKSAAQKFDFDENFAFIGDLKPNQTGQATLTFTINKDAPLQEYLMELEFRFTDEDKVLLEEKSVKFFVNAQAQSPTPVIIAVIVLAVIGAGVFYWNRKRKK